MDFYTNCQIYGSRVLYRGVEDGRRIRRKIDYHPTLYVESPKPSQFTTVTGTYVEPIQPGSIRDCREFTKRYNDSSNFRIYGNQRYEYSFLSETFKRDIEWDRRHIRVVNIDIEVASENGFPEPAQASEMITAITVKINGKFTAFSYTDFKHNRPDVRYVRCTDEIDLIKRFIDEWSSDYPDAIIGWNIKFFDIPYLVNRITNVLGEAWAKRLSPWGVISERTVKIMGRDQVAYFPMGVAVLDYIELYKKFSPKGMSQESYKLDHICFVELGERKIQYEGTLHKLYKENPQLFVEYNIRDVDLVEKLDDKLKLVDLALTLAYDSRTNYEDVFAQTRMWDQLIYNHLMHQNKVVPPNESKTKSEAYVGAYVKDPQLGLHRWVASFDLNSLYPHLIMQFNISPDMLVEPDQYTANMRRILSSNINVDDLLAKSVDVTGLVDDAVTLTPNGQFFHVEHQGFLAKMMEDMYNDRSVYKKKAIEAKKELQKETDPDKRHEIENRISRYNNLQLAKKVCLNSAYGALGNEFFRFFDVRQASAITTAGQLAIRWIERKLNEYLNKLLKTGNKDYVIASDTDSVYLCLDELVCQTFSEADQADTRKIITFLDKVCEVKIQSFIDKSYKELAVYLNAYDQKMQMKREALADRGIWTAKKRYILNVYNSEGVEYAKPDVKVMGLEMIKSSTPAAVRDKLWKALDVVLNGTEDDMLKFIDDFRVEYKTLPIEDIAFPRGVNNISKYTLKTGGWDSGTPIHVRGSIVYNNLVKSKKLQNRLPLISEGEKIKFIYLREPNVLQSNIIAFPATLSEELGVHSMIDYTTQFEKSFIEALKIILNAIGWKTERTASLEDFFS